MENNQQNNKSSKKPEQSSRAMPESTLMAVLAYVGPLVIVSYLTQKNNPFVKFHIKQGLVLLVIEVAMWVIGMIVWMLWPIIQIVNIIVIVLSIMGILNVLGKKEKELPIIGSFSKYINI